MDKKGLDEGMEIVLKELKERYNEEDIFFRYIQPNPGCIGWSEDADKKNH